MTTSDTLGERLRAAVGELVRATRTANQLPANQAAALGELEREGPRTTAQLAASCRIRHQSMTSIVQQLIARGEVMSTSHPTDGRAQLLSITADGRSVIVRDRENRAGRLAHEIDTQLSEDEREALSSAVTLIERLARAERESSEKPIREQAARPPAGLDQSGGSGSRPRRRQAVIATESSRIRRKLSAVKSDQSDDVAT
ncbi:MarR family winged helix-turn-helix transcriptional regulator [Subtercola lobariae]|uniref:HTH marR-type domain-containing protein n=1 Tax=Subtercola lobariae TaxID=1588641 RepID=A0A917AZ86_9MICO|nr:helix-turn-helix domain-containing protein [Subtercola lobariae]GGF10218.1 hypothetical protein GCM10011399_00110 [Subtercola lobariae]